MQLMFEEKGSIAVHRIKLNIDSECYLYNTIHVGGHTYIFFIHFTSTTSLAMLK